MSENDWTTTSVKLKRELKVTLNKYCEVEKTTPNKLIKGLIEKKLEFMLNPNALRKDDGIPLIAQHKFNYNATTDNFEWVLERTGHIHHLSKNEISIDFLEKLKQAIDEAIDKRNTEKSQPESKTVVPSDLLDFEVRK